MGIAAAARQAQDGAVMGPGQHRCAGPDPVLAFPRRQRIEIEDDIPLRGVGAIALQRCPPPQPAGILGVAPEVVEVGAAPRHQRDIVRPIEDRGEHIPIGGKCRVTKTPQCCGILRLYKGERLRSLDLLEPEIRIVIRRRDRRPCIYGHGGASAQPRSRHRLRDGMPLAPGRVQKTASRAFDNSHPGVSF
jgi:hypothetical protein